MLRLLLLTLTTAATGYTQEPAVPDITVDPALQASVEKIISEREARKKAEDDTKKAEDSAKALQTGTVVPLSVVWDNGMWFRTPNKDWNVHIGGRVMFQSDWWAQPTVTKGTAPGNGGIPAVTGAAGSGVGVLDDGFFFRRVRLKLNGNAYKYFEFDAEVNFEQVNLITFDHVWGGFKDVPFLGTVRVGQHKVPQSLEMMGSDYHLTFLERSSLADAIWTLFAPGVFVANNFLDNRVSFQTMFHRVQPLSFYTGSDFGSDYASTTRVTGIPVYERDGEEVIHVGASYQWRQADLGRTIVPGTTGSTVGDTSGAVRFRARPELRDAIGIGTTFAGNASRFIDTGFLAADHVNTASPEFLLIDGPFSIQAEAAFSFVDNARFLYGPQTGQSIGNPMFWGGYAEFSYILTGEHRGYDKRFGVYDRIQVRNNFGWDDCDRFTGWGAWQLAYRYSYLDLNDRAVNGGLMGQHTAGLNWYFNDNAKLQFQYNNIHRDVPVSNASGTIHGFGVLMQYYF